MAGETGPVLDVVSLPIAMLIAGFLAIACYNSVEIYIFILRTFRRRNGLYFWSMLAANSGIPLHSVSSLLRYFSLAPNTPMTVLVVLGWWLMVTGQSVVLYSRLHLVVGEPRKLRYVAAMIAAVFITLQLPTSVLFIATNAMNLKDGNPLVSTFNVFEKTQLAVFTLQESIISGLYVYEASTALKHMEVIKGRKVRMLFRELVALFILVVVLDITLMTTEYTNHFLIQTTYKPLVYSIKLKVEALVLNDLVTLLQSGMCYCRNDGGGRRGSSSLASQPFGIQLSDASTTVPESDSWWPQHRATSLGLVSLVPPSATRRSTADGGGRIKSLKKIVSM
ncbi:hypothetical protein F4775DRAFT_561715 [Biscogniauxia sp. FL1348]|nr:hypothetical protein F4775DRAFT_561715 [Biscogniauxia sp. FL1348]